jgi:hypothetical protein
VERLKSFVGSECSWDGASDSTVGAESEVDRQTVYYSATLCPPHQRPSIYQEGVIEKMPKVIFANLSKQGASEIHARYET